MANEINNNYKKQPTTNTQKTEDNKNKPLTKEEIAKAAYEGSISHLILHLFCCYYNQKYPHIQKESTKI